MLLTVEEQEKVLKILSTPCAVEPPAPFDFEAKGWNEWKIKYEHYIQGLEDAEIAIKDQDKVHLLMHLMGEYAEEVFRILEMDVWTSDMDLKETLHKLDYHFRLVGMECLYKRYNFHRRQQVPGESVMEYIKALKFFARCCNFGDNYDEMLRDKLIVGIRSDTAREKIFNYDDFITFEAATEIIFNDELRQARLHG